MNRHTFTYYGTVICGNKDWVGVRVSIMSMEKLRVGDEIECNTHYGPFRVRIDT